MQGAAGNMMTGTATTTQSPPFTLPMRYMLFGMLGFVAFAVDLLVQDQILGQGSTFAPQVIGLTHLLTLGSLMSFVMGAVYQLATVAFLIPVIAVRLAKLNFWLYAVAVMGLTYTMTTWQGWGLLIFGSMATMSIWVFAVIMLTSVAKSSIHGPMKWFIMTAHIYLIIAIVFAWLLTLAPKVDLLEPYFTRILISHILLVMGGFFTFLIFGFSFKLIPMFTLSHGFNTARQKWTYGWAQLGILATIAGTWMHMPIMLDVGISAGGIAFALQIVDVRGILQKRMRKRIEPPIRSATIAFWIGLLGAGCTLAQLIWMKNFAVWQGIIILYLLGFITLMIMSYAYKIVPFFIWSKRYGTRAGKGKIPLIADLLDVNQSTAVLVTAAIGMFLVSLGIVRSWTVLAAIGGVLISLSIIVFCMQILWVIRPTQVVKELRDRD